MRFPSSKIPLLTFSLTTLLILTGCNNPRSEPVMDDMPETLPVSGTMFDDEDQQAIEDIINEVIDTTGETGDQTIVKTSLSRDEAIAIAEPVLFQAYGTGLIISERPYKTFLVDKIWTIMGKDLPEGTVGGVFSITIDAVDGKVIDMIHGQ